MPSAQMLRAWIEDDTFQWLITEEILDEYKEILARCKVRRDLIAHAISLIRTAAQVVPDVPGYGISPDQPDGRKAELCQPAPHGSSYPDQSSNQ